MIKYQYESVRANCTSTGNTILAGQQTENKFAIFIWNETSVTVPILNLSLWDLTMFNLMGSIKTIIIMHLGSVIIQTIPFPSA